MLVETQALPEHREDDRGGPKTGAASTRLRPKPSPIASRRELEQ